MPAKVAWSGTAPPTYSNDPAVVTRLPSASHAPCGHGLSGCALQIHLASRQYLQPNVGVTGMELPHRKKGAPHSSPFHPSGVSLSAN